MDYNETMKLPKNFVLMNDDEMMYLEGGGLYKNTFKQGNFEYTVTIRVKDAAVALLNSAAGITGILAGVCAIHGSGGAATQAAAAGIWTSVAGLGLSQRELANSITITRKSLPIGGGGGTSW